MRTIMSCAQALSSGCGSAANAAITSCGLTPRCFSRRALRGCDAAESNIPSSIVAAPPGLPFFNATLAGDGFVRHPGVGTEANTPRPEQQALSFCASVKCGEL